MTLPLKLESLLETVAVAFLNDEEFSAWLTFGDDSCPVIIVSHLEWYTELVSRSLLGVFVRARSGTSEQNTCMHTKQGPIPRIHKIILCIRAHLLTFKYANK